MKLPLVFSLGCLGVFTALAMGPVGLPVGAEAEVTLCGPVKPRKPVGPCEPYAEVCRHCTDCSQCKHCAKDRGKCSVCWEK